MRGIINFGLAMARAKRLLFVSFLITAAACGSGARASTCPALDALVGTGRDAAEALRQCLEAAPANAVVALPQGVLIVASPVMVDRPVRLTTAGLAPSSPPCRDRGTSCATLMFRIGLASAGRVSAPFDIHSADVTLDHLVFSGDRGNNQAALAKLCRGATRPLGGIVRSEGDRLHVTASVFRDAGCATAFEYHAGNDSVFRSNLFARNGDHAVYPMWADGLTVHDATRLDVSDNHFVDNTDVQLIFGGCRDCRVRGNDIRHGGDARYGSFAALVLHSWPRATSGRYDGTVVSGNRIDCGLARHCGFGLMIGAMPWYNAPTEGGLVQGNRIANAQLAINVDALTGPMTVRNNRVVAGLAATGAATIMTSCGPKPIAGDVNVAPGSSRFLGASMFDPVMRKAESVDFTLCVANAVPGKFGPFPASS